jgi:hypothetical protein
VAGSRVVRGLVLACHPGPTLAVTVLTALTLSGFDHLVLIAEVIIIVLFAAYWGVQTKELWDLRATDGADGTEARQTHSVAE